MGAPVSSPHEGCGAPLAHWISRVFSKLPVGPHALFPVISTSLVPSPFSKQKKSIKQEFLIFNSLFSVYLAFCFSSKISQLPLISRFGNLLFRIMALSQDQELEYMVDEYYDTTDFDDSTIENESPRSTDLDDSLDSDSDFEDDFDVSKSKTDTSAIEARNGKDMQGIPWERLNFTRDKYRETRLKQYKNYESLSRSREDLEKECKEVRKGHSFYDFQFNTRLVKSTIVHFQIVNN